MTGRNKELTVSRADKPGVRSKISIVKREEKLGTGREGRITRVLVAPGKAATNEIHLAYKELSYLGREYYDRTISNYVLAKNAGLPVPHTFRATDDKRGILMTDLTEGGKKIVLSQNNVRSNEVVNLYNNKPEIMKNFALAQNILTDEITNRSNPLINLATRAKLLIPGDAWFVIVSPDGSYDFLLGDFKSISPLDETFHTSSNNNEYGFNNFRKLLAMIQEYGTDPSSAKQKLGDLDFEREWNMG